MKYTIASVAALFLLSSACKPIRKGDYVPVIPDQGSGSGTAGTGTATTGDGTTTGPDLPVGGSVVCEGGQPDTGEGGFPFHNLSYTVPNIAGCPKTSTAGVTYSFTCTLCPGGTNGIGGTYRYYEESKSGAITLDVADWKETFAFSGNTWVNVIEGKDIDGKVKTVTARGYFFCPAGHEYSGIKYKSYWNTIFVYTEVDSNDADPFGMNVGATDLAFLGTSTNAGSNDILYDSNLCWDSNGSAQSWNQYCKIGSTIQGRECTDPFE